MQTIEITLSDARLVRIYEAVTIPEEVYLRFVSPVYSLGTLAVTAKNGNRKKDFKTRGEPIDITELCRKAGTVDIEVSLLVRETPVKTWRIEPLILREINHAFEAIPEIEEMRRAIDSMRGELATLKKAFAELVALEKENENI